MAKEANSGSGTNDNEPDPNDVVDDPKADENEDPKADDTGDDAGDDPKGDSDADPENDDPGGPPEKYELTLSKDSLLGQEALDEIATKARERGLSNEEAQAEVNGREQMAEEQAATLETAHAKWENACKEHPEFGGDNYKESVAVRDRVLEKYGSPELTEMLTDRTGLINEPSVFNFLVKLGKAGAAEDKFVNAENNDTVVTKSGAETMYGKDGGADGDQAKKE